MNKEEESPALTAHSQKSHLILPTSVIKSQSPRNQSLRDLKEKKGKDSQGNKESIGKEKPIEAEEDKTQEKKVAKKQELTMILKVKNKPEEAIEKKEEMKEDQ